MAVQNDVNIMVKATDKASPVFKQLEQEGSKLGGVLSGIYDTGKQVAIGFAGIGVAGVGMGLSSAKAFEKTRTSIETMLKDGEKAGALLSELSDFAAKTPFEFPEIADAGKSLLAFGFGADQITDTLRRLGDVGSAVGIPLGEISEIYGKARVQGRLFMEDINQLTGRGVPIITELAKVLGVTEGEVRGLVETGKVGFPELESAMKNMTDQGGMFAGGMEAQSKTLDGILSTAKDNITGILREMVGMSKTGEIAEGSILATTKSFIESFNSFISENSGAIVEFFKGAISVVQESISAIIGYIKGFIDYWSIMIGFLQSGNLESFFSNIGTSIKNGMIIAGNAVNAFIMKIGEYFGVDLREYALLATSIFGEFGKKIEEFFGKLPSIIDEGIAQITARFEYLKTAFLGILTAFQTEGFSGGMSALGEFLFTEISNSINSLYERTGELIELLSPVLKSVFEGALTTMGIDPAPILEQMNMMIEYVIGIVEQAVEIWNQYKEYVIGFIGFMGETFYNLFEQLKTIFFEALSALTEFWQEHSDSIMTIITALGVAIGVIVAGVIAVFAGLMKFLEGFLTHFSEIFSGVLQILGGVIDFIASVFRGDIEGAFSAMWEVIKGIWNTAVAVVMGIVDGFLNMFGTSVGELVAMGVNKISEMWAGIKEFFVDGITNAINNVKGFYDSIIETFNSLWSGISTALSDLWASIEGWFSDLATSIYTWGSNLATAIWDGFASAIEGVKNKISNAISNLSASFNAGISSIGIPGFAKGGKVEAGKLIVVGENGPEFFVPPTNGEIIPNNKLESFVQSNSDLSGGIQAYSQPETNQKSTTSNLNTYNISFSISGAQDPRGVASEVEKIIMRKFQLQSAGIS